MWVWLILFFNLLPLQLQMLGAHQGIMMKPEGCSITECGGVDIPYPFGIGPNCYANPFFDITCKHNSTLILTQLNLKVVNLTHNGYYQHQVRVSYPFVRVCGSSNSSTVQPIMPLSKVTKLSTSSRSPFRLTPTNMVVRGCNRGAAIMSPKGDILYSCTPMCNANTGGSATCTMSLPYIFISTAPFQIGLGVSYNQTTLDGGSTCVSLSLTDGSDTEYSDFQDTLSTSLLWTSEDVKKSEHTNCTMDAGGVMETCHCQIGYCGNPYLLNGCQVPEECNGCTGHCVVDYYLHNSTWDDDTNQIRYQCDQSKPSMHLAMVTGLFTSIGSISFVLLVGFLLYRLMKRMKEKKRRVKNFKENGGLLLQQHLSTIEHGVVERISIFTTKELEKASNNFHRDRVLGQGGQGTVYKGILPNGRIVAIKKAKIDGNHCEEFINEVVILSQINHRNVVKLLGCCLEADAPLLVYEYVPNGMLSQHIHSPREDCHISWQMRLQIAIEIAGALAYLHSSSSTPIYHRDIKSSNILLDEKYRAKIADFGISRTVSIDQTHLTTNVVGTFGYLDPEYFHSHQFTEKSDVYSFGVVLLELLTGKEAVLATDSDESTSLAVQFLEQMESSKLFDILDPYIVEESKEELLAVTNLATRCLNMVGEDRPTMKEIAMTLDGIRSQQPRSLEIESSSRQASEQDNSAYLLPFHSYPSSFSIDV